MLDPIFNRFAPLPDGPQRADVLALAERAGVRVGEVYKVDASRRTTGANAYVTGLGPTKRVVLFDTLLEHFTRDEVRLVVAHELAHVRHRDVPRGLLFSALVAPAATARRRARSPEAWRAADAQPGPAVLPALALAAGLVAVPVATRRQPALAAHRGPRGPLLARPHRGARALRRLRAPDRACATSPTPTPPRWLTALLATHPPTLERIGLAVAFSAALPGSVRLGPCRRTRAGS